MASIPSLSSCVSALLAVLLLAACGDGKPCSTSTDCGSHGVCLPIAEGEVRYCAALDTSCPTGLRWDGTAGHGLDGQCVGLTGGPDAMPADGEATNACGPDGMVCMPTTDPCKKPGKCNAGVCEAITNAADGTKCGTASDACHTDPVCKAGQCQAQGAHPEGYNYDSSNYLARCCGGKPTSINSASNCGACGISCGAGRQCVNTGATNSQQWWCTCIADSECWSGCCANGTPSVCSPSTCGNPALCITCPGAATCTADQNPHYWCHY
jgi:hypothetical protein